MNVREWDSHGNNVVCEVVLDEPALHTESFYRCPYLALTASTLENLTVQEVMTHWPTCQEYGLAGAHPDAYCVIFHPRGVPSNDFASVDTLVSIRPTD